MEITYNPEEVFQKIQEKHPRIIGIDGIDGAGKTTFAKKMAEKSYHRISLDNYLNKKQDGYFDFLKFEKLKSDLNKLGDSFIVIEGTLLLKVLEVIYAKPDFFIYIDNNIWLDDWLEDYGGKYYGKQLDEIVAEEEKMVNRVVRATDPGSKEYKMDGFRKEVFEYSFKYKPWNKADIIFRIR